jgi:hypothetical protein
MNTKEFKLTVTNIGYKKGKKNMRIIWRIALVAMLLVVPQVMARPSNLSTFELTYPVAKGSKIDACNLCHNSPSGGDARNPYGLYEYTGNKKPDFSGKCNRLSHIITSTEITRI